MKKTKLTPNRAKKNLIVYHNFVDSDFFKEGKEIYLNCKDNFMEKSTDVFEELQLRIREEYDAQ